MWEVTEREQVGRERPRGNRGLLACDEAVRRHCLSGDVINRPELAVAMWMLKTLLKSEEAQVIQ